MAARHLAHMSKLFLTFISSLSNQPDHVFWKQIKNKHYKSYEEHQCISGLTSWFFCKRMVLCCEIDLVFPNFLYKMNACFLMVIIINCGLPFLSRNNMPSMSASAILSQLTSWKFSKQSKQRQDSKLTDFHEGTKIKEKEQVSPWPFLSFSLSMLQLLRVTRDWKFVYVDSFCWWWIPSCKTDTSVLVISSVGPPRE